MSKALIGLSTTALVAGVLVVLAPVASAGTSEFQEAIADTDPVFERWDSDDCPPGDDDGVYYYRVFDLAITESGGYDYRDIGYLDDDEFPGFIDIEIGIYEYGTFDPADPGGPGCIATIDDDGSFAIPSAGTYTLVLSTNDEENTGVGYWSITGPGMAYLGSAPDAGQTPPPWYQAYARASANAVCDEGWKPSYAEWPNDGKGGFTCERVLVYNNNTGKWDTDLSL